MATITHIPYPIEVSVKTAGYTIPANRYARVIVNLEGSATFTINAVTALRGTQNNVLGSSILYTNNASGNQNLATVASPPSNTGSAFTTATDQKTVVQEYWLPAGAIIGGTGTWRAVVEEYGG